MAKQSAEAVREQALELTQAERAKLASDLVASLDGPADSGVTEAWDEEILKRLAEVDSGTAELIDRDEFTRRLQQRPNNA